MATTSRLNKLLLGRVVKLSSVGLAEHSCAQVRVKRNEFDSHLNMFFAKSEDFWSWDKSKITQLGDVVLVREMEESLTRKVTHQIDQIMFKHGHVIDPITKRRVLNEDYQDKILSKSNLISEMLGQKRLSEQYNTTEDALADDGVPDMDLAEKGNKKKSSSQDRKFDNS